MLGFSMLGYKPTWSFLNQVGQAVEVRIQALGFGSKGALVTVGLSSAVGVGHSPPDLPAVHIFMLLHY
jgi:hypothetical protein